MHNLEVEKNNQQQKDIYNLRNQVLNKLLDIEAILESKKSCPAFSKQVLSRAETRITNAKVAAEEAEKGTERGWFQWILSFFISNDYDAIKDQWSKALIELNEAYLLLVSQKRSELQAYSFVRVPEYWQCQASYYNNSDGCDCGCGAWDPDCNFNPFGYELYGCLPGHYAQCVPPSICQYPSNQTLAPVSWICDVSYYNASDGCDCDCGAWDPDCNTESEIFGCVDTGSVQCSPINFSCIYYAPEGWKCNPSFYNASGGCDCGCGILDPDCTQTNTQVFGCPCNTMMCNANAQCEGLCNGKYLVWSTASCITSISFDIIVVVLIVLYQLT